MIKNRFSHIVYLICFIIVGILQKIGYDFFSYSAAWHAFFYVLVIPIINIVFAFYFVKEKSYYVYPTIATMLSIFVYILFGNGGLGNKDLGFNAFNTLTVTIPATFSPILGIALAKSEKVIKLLNNINLLISKKFFRNKIETLPPNKKRYMPSDKKSSHDDF